MLTQLEDDAFETMDGRHGDDTRAIARWLRSGGPLHPDGLEMLAELFDPESDLTWKLVLEKRRRGPAREFHEGRDLKIGRLIAAMVDAGGRTKVSTLVAMDLFSIRRSHAFECHRLWRYVEQRKAGDAKEST
jgi:hypothetical protein